jgi:Tol biopolymer transport system component
VGSALLLALTAPGCPQLLDDHFQTSDGGLASPPGGLSSGSDSGGSDSGGSTGSGATAGEPAVGPGGSAGGGGSTAAGAPSDAGAPACAWGAFGEPEKITGLGFGPTASQWGPALAADGATLILSSSLPGGFDSLYQATRSDRGSVFSGAIALTSLNGSANSGTPFLGFDGTRLYFYSDRSGGVGSRDLYVATRANPLDSFESASLVPGVNSAASDHLPWVSPDELTLYFSSARAGGSGGYDLWTATRAARAGAFGSPKRISELDTASSEEGASLTPDELTLFFASDRANGAGKLDLWMSTRASKSDDFGAPVNLAGLNSAANDMNVAVSADGRELFFTSDRGAGANAPHVLWRALRSCE